MMHRGMRPADHVDDKIPFESHCYNQDVEQIDEFWRFRFDFYNNIYSVITI